MLGPTRAYILTHPPLTSDISTSRSSGPDWSSPKISGLGVVRDVPVSGTGCIASSAFGFSLLFVSIGIFLAAAVPVPAMPCGG